MSRRARRVGQHRVVRVVEDGVAGERAGGDGAGIDQRLRLAVAVGGLHAEAGLQVLLDAAGEVPGPSRVRVGQHDGVRDLVAGRVVDARHAGRRGRRAARRPDPPLPLIGPVERRLRRRQVGVVVRQAVDVLVVDELGGADEAPRQALVDADVGAPGLRELEVGVGDGQVDARRRRAGDGRRLVEVRVRVERAVARVLDLLEPGEHARVADLVGDPDVGRLAGEDAGAAADLRVALAADVPVEADARRPQRRRVRQLAGAELDRRARRIAERQGVDVGVGVGGLTPGGDVDADAGGEGQVRERPELVLHVGARCTTRRAAGPASRGPGCSCSGPGSGAA